MAIKPQECVSRGAEIESQVRELERQIDAHLKAYHLRGQITSFAVGGHTTAPVVDRVIKLYQDHWSVRYNLNSRAFFFQDLKDVGGQADQLCAPDKDCGDLTRAHYAK